MFKKQFGSLTLTTLVILSLLITGEIAQAQQFSSDFDTLSLDLELMYDLFQGGGDQLVTFDSEAARKQGYSPKSIKLAEELTAFTNDLIIEAKKNRKAKGVRTDVRELGSSIKKYSLLNTYFQDAAENAKTISKDEHEARIKGLFPPVNEYVCGSIWHPVPSSAAPWKIFGPYSSNKAAEQHLKDIGYHGTPDSAGGGFTRPQTYKWALCGFKTYRDHAYVSKKEIHEQNYTGSIPGEPNPEIWRSGPWPYPTWPAYVVWWHRTY